MPSIVITNIRNVSVDDSPVGALVNAFQEANNAVAVQIALETFCESKDAELTAKEAAHTAALATLNASHAAALAAKDTALAAAVEAEARAVHARLDALVQAGQEAHAAGDLDALGAVLDAAYAYTSGARRAKLETDLASAQAAATEAVDKLAAFNG